MKDRRLRLKSARIYVILDPRVTSRHLPGICRSVIRAGADIVQYRFPAGKDGAILRAATRIVAAAREASDSALVIVNNRPDIALASGSDGVHLGVHDVPIPAARMIVGDDALVGATTHSAGEARIAARRGADYLSYGPVFASPLKPGLSPRRFSYLGAVRRLGLPFFAIGGIRPDNLEVLLAAGIDRFCVCSSVLRSRDPASVVRRLRALALRTGKP